MRKCCKALKICSLENLVINGREGMRPTAFVVFLPLEQGKISHAFIYIFCPGLCLKQAFYFICLFVETVKCLRVFPFISSRSLVCYYNFQERTSDAVTQMAWLCGQVSEQWSWHEQQRCFTLLHRLLLDSFFILQLGFLSLVPRQLKFHDISSKILPVCLQIGLS